MTNKMTSKRLFDGERAGLVKRIKTWHGKEMSDILFQYGTSLYHVHSTIFSGDGDIVYRLTTKNPGDIENNFSNVQIYEVN
jgi:hypothetical protein